MTFVYDFICNPLEQFEINNYKHYNYLLSSLLLYFNIDTHTYKFFLEKFYFFVYINNLSFFKHSSLFLGLRCSINENFFFIIVNYILQSFFDLFHMNDFFLIPLLLNIIILFFFFRQFNFIFYFYNALNFVIIFLLKFVISVVEGVNSILIKYNSYFFTIFFFILFFNLLGLIPFVKSFTSMIVINFFLACASFFSLSYEGLLLHELQFFNRFAPSNVPFAILPGLVLIELISYFMRPNSLAIRLFSNMLAGHILIKLFISFCLILGSKSLLLFSGCFCFIGVLMVLEVFINFLQAYIFMLLILLYIDEVLSSSH